MNDDPMQQDQQTQTGLPLTEVRVRAMGILEGSPAPGQSTIPQIQGTQVQAQTVQPINPGNFSPTLEQVIINVMQQVVNTHPVLTP